MKKEHYSSGLTREQFLYFEMRIVAGLITQGLSRSEIIEKIYSENLFQFPTERMIKTIASACFRRIDALDAPQLTYLIANASPEISKQANLYSIMCENSIVYDFMTEVVGEKYRTQQFDFSQKDVNVFFIELEEKIPQIASWSESTVKKIKQVLLRFLVECDYLENPSSHKLMPVYLHSELDSVIRAKGDLAALAAFNCFC